MASKTTKAVYAALAMGATMGIGIFDAPYRVVAKNPQSDEEAQRLINAANEKRQRRAERNRRKRKIGGCHERVS